MALHVGLTVAIERRMKFKQAFVDRAGLFDERRMVDRRVKLAVSTSSRTKDFAAVIRPVVIQPRSAFSDAMSIEKRYFTSDFSIRS